MVKYIISQIKYIFSQLNFNRKKDIDRRLSESFGKAKKGSFTFEMIEKYFRNKDNSRAFQVLSDKTCNDLDFDELFMFLDRTNSKVGQQYFYNQLRTINPNKNLTTRNESLIDEFIKHPELRISLQKKIATLDHKDTYNITTLFQEKHLKPPKWFFIIKLLSFASLASLVITFFVPSFPR